MDSFSHAKSNYDSRNLSTEHNLFEFKNGMILPLLMFHNVPIANQSNTSFLWSQKPLSNSLMASWCHFYAKLLKHQAKEPFPLSSGNPDSMNAILWSSYLICSSRPRTSMHNFNAERGILNRDQEHLHSQGLQPATILVCANEFFFIFVLSRRYRLISVRAITWFRLSFLIREKIILSATSSDHRFWISS